MAVVESDSGKCLQSACAIFQCQVVVVAPLVILPRSAGGHQAESVALGLQRLDANHGIHLCIVFGTGRGDDFYILDINRFQPFQFACIAYLFIINIDFRLTLGQHLELPVASLHHRQHREQVFGRADITQNGVLHIHRYAPLCHFILRNLAFHLYSFHHIGLRLQGYRADIAHTNRTTDGFIAYIRHIDRDAWLLARNDKVAVLVAYPTVDEC